VRPELRSAFESFRRVLAVVEGAKGSLAAAAPGGRSAGVPLADALAAFEQGLHDASTAMSSWHQPEMEEAWSSCREGLEESRRGAERLRLGNAPEGYEQLYGQLADLMEPLDAFAQALERFHELGL